MVRKYLRSLRSRKYAALAVVLAVLLLFTLGVNLYFAKQRRPVPAAPAASSDQYPLLASRIFVDNPNDVIVNFSKLRQDLRQELSNLGYNYSFYFEYLPSGTSIKINQEVPMVGASLLKVPLIMNLFRAAEQGKIDLNQTLTIQEGDIDRRSGQLWQKGAGAQITVREAARETIVQSDNTAVNMLIAASANDFDLFQQSIDELDINLSVENENQTTLGAQAYSSVLKCLYLSCFLNYGDSQQIMDWLTEAQSPPRLRGGVPDDIKLAHKYGTSAGRSESDCGIVFVPKRPYIICMMVDAPPEQANVIISDVSRKIYNYVSSVK